MAKYVEKLNHFRQAIRQNNGYWGSFLQLFRTDEIKFGDLIGEDKFGNKYYQNKLYYIGRSRWVEYSPQYGWDYDGSQVPAEWHRWLHYMTDDPPTLVQPPQSSWMIDHKQNFSGTENKYIAYSTTTPKIHAWVPPKK